MKNKRVVIKKKIVTLFIPRYGVVTGQKQPSTQAIKGGGIGGRRRPAKQQRTLAAQNP
jgi:hypothetical protein